MYWRIVLSAVVAVILAGTHWKAYVAGGNAIRAEYTASSLKASEDARAKERALQAKVEGLDRDLQKQKAANAALSRAHAERLREYEIALGRATDSAPAPSGTAGPFAAIAGECGRALVALDEHARGLAATAAALQRYASEVRVTTQQNADR